mmetsp:Transcript_29371/g.80617  ORF Transcript_29371/g.80617 Transcript_29371/m.80617 type:complete len:202 (-) Transcript_29371:157-762(-)
MLAPVLHGGGQCVHGLTDVAHAPRCAEHKEGLPGCAVVGRNLLPSKLCDHVQPPQQCILLLGILEPLRPAPPPKVHILDARGLARHGHHQHGQLHRLLQEGIALFPRAAEHRDLLTPHHVGIVVAAKVILKCPIAASLALLLCSLHEAAKIAPQEQVCGGHAVETSEVRTARFVKVVELSYHHNWVPQRVLATEVQGDIQR